MQKAGFLVAVLWQWACFSVSTEYLRTSVVVTQDCLGIRIKESASIPEAKRADASKQGLAYVAAG